MVFMYMLCWNLVQKHMTNGDRGYFVCVYLFLMRFIFYFFIFFFICCPQSHISHYYVRSVFPHCNGSKLHKSPNPARPLRLAQKICQHLQKKNQQKKQSQLSVLYKQDQPVSYPIHRSVRLI